MKKKETVMTEVLNQNSLGASPETKEAARRLFEGYKLLREMNFSDDDALRATTDYFFPLSAGSIDCQVERSRTHAFTGIDAELSVAEVMSAARCMSMAFDASRVIGRQRPIDAPMHHIEGKPIPGAQGF
jgi:hypothetical protein